MIALIVTVAAIVPNTRASIHVTDEDAMRTTFDQLMMWWNGKAAACRDVCGKRRVHGQAKRELTASYANGDVSCVPSHH